jgi:hypothetical protein
MKELNCPLSEEQLTAFLDNELPDPQARQLARHIMACPQCSRVLGRLNAADALLRLPSVDRDEVPAPENVPDLSSTFWPTLKGRLDAVDQLINATDGVSRKRQRSGLMRLALAGAAIVLAAVITQQLMLNSMSGLQPEQLVQMHAGYVPSAPLSNPQAGHAQVALGSPDAFQPAPPTMIDIDGTPALWSQYLVDGRAVSVLHTARNAVNLRDMQPITADGKRYHLSQNPAGSVLVDSSGDIWHIVTADPYLPPQRMLTLLRQISSLPGPSASM